VIRGEAYGNLYLTEKAGGPFDESDEEAAIVLSDYASIAIDNARLYSDVETRRRDLERAVARLEATTEVARAVGGETDLDRVMGTISKRARALVEARSLVILLEDRDELQIAASAGEFDRNVRGERLAIGWTTWGGVLRGLRPERVADVRSRLGISPGELGVRASAALLVPLNFRGTALGVIAAFDRLQGGPEFDEEDERLMVAFAASAATAVFTAKSVAEDQLRHSIAASEGERTRWARELHDDTLQALGAIRVMLASAIRSGELDALRSAGESARDQLEEAITGLRGLISELRPAALDELGLWAAVEGLADYHRDRSGLEVNADLSLRYAEGEVETRLAPELENAVYRVLQEALTNIAKHAGAERVDLQVVEDEASIEVVVRDDGLGFEVEGRHEGFGLLGMRERIELAGGQIEITSRPGAGTEVRARAPAVRADGPGRARRPPAAATGS
jgi:signal transduction histidine kinase